MATNYQISNNTFTISGSWDIIPAPGDNFSIFVPSIENGLIRSNLMQDNPRGILLYAAGFYNVSIVNNTLKDSGGIWLFAIQDTKALSYSKPKFGSYRNIEINGNSLLNTKVFVLLILLSLRECVTRTISGVRLWTVLKFVTIRSQAC